VLSFNISKYMLLTENLPDSTRFHLKTLLFEFSWMDINRWTKWIHMWIFPVFVSQPSNSIFFWIVIDYWYFCRLNQSSEVMTGRHVCMVSREKLARWLVEFCVATIVYFVAIRWNTARCKYLPTCACNASWAQVRLPNLIGYILSNLIPRWN
jgi:hypothetical protein